jgi:hypothetical protein
MQVCGSRGSSMDQAAGYPWQWVYQAAMLETDRSKLEQRLETAKFAIQARLQELNGDHQGFREEREAIESALAGLRILQEEVRSNSAGADGQE